MAVETYDYTRTGWAVGTITLCGVCHKAIQVQLCEGTQDGEAWSYLMFVHLATPGVYHDPEPQRTLVHNKPPCNYGGCAYDPATYTCPACTGAI